MSGPEVTDKYVGESERKMRELFAEARRNAPSVVVFDEFDSIAAKRTGRDDGGSRAGNAVVAQLLTELDGFRPEIPVLIIGTTNRLDLIDEALLRPSRFRPIQIGPPELDARREIAKYHAKHFGVAVSAELLDKIAEATDQFSGDDIRSLFRDARAGELTGKKVPASPYRLGELVGQLRRARQLRDLQRSGVTPAPPVTADGHRQRLRDQSSGSVRRRQFDRQAAATAGSRPARGGKSRGGTHRDRSSRARRAHARAGSPVSRQLNRVAEEFVGREEAVRVLGLGVLCREHVLLIGPPGTAKTAIVGVFEQMFTA